MLIILLRQSARLYEMMEEEEKYIRMSSSFRRFGQEIILYVRMTASSYII